MILTAMILWQNRSVELLREQTGGDLSAVTTAAAAGAVMTAGVLLLAVIIAAETTVIRKRIKSENRKNEGIRRFVEHYLEKCGEDAVSMENRVWAEKEKNRSGLLWCGSLLWTIGVAAFWLADGREGLRLSEELVTMTGPVLMILAVQAAYQIRRILIRQKILRFIQEERPLETLWLQYDFHDFDGPAPVKWSVSDMDMAVAISRAGDCGVSCTLAEGLWERFGKKRKSGAYYMQYHFLQWHNYLSLGETELAETHLRCVEAELAADPRNRYNRKVKERLEELRNRAETAREEERD